MRMMVRVDGDSIKATLDMMIENIQKCKKSIPSEFLEWQAEDMNRKSPEVDVSDNETSTDIYRRSFRRRRMILSAKPRRRTAIVVSSRPILRPELLESFHKRMINLMIETIQWE